MNADRKSAKGGPTMVTACPTQTIEDDLKTDLEFEKHDEIERLLRHLSAAWDEEDFSDLPPKNLPPEL
jgi:hypothetical protein